MKNNESKLELIFKISKKQNVDIGRLVTLINQWISIRGEKLTGFQHASLLKELNSGICEHFYYEGAKQGVSKERIDQAFKRVKKRLYSKENISNQKRQVNESYLESVLKKDNISEVLCLTDSFLSGDYHIQRDRETYDRERILAEKLHNKFLLQKISQIGELEKKEFLRIMKKLEDYLWRSYEVIKPGGRENAIYSSGNRKTNAQQEPSSSLGSRTGIFSRLRDYFSYRKRLIPDKDGGYMQIVHSR